MDPLTLAAIFATVGTFIGGFSSVRNDVDSINTLDEDKRHVDRIYSLEKEAAKEKYDQAKEEAQQNAAQAEKQADMTDLAADINEAGISNDFNTAIDNLYLNQASDAWNWNSAAMQAGSSAGASYAALAGSGVRAGSSMSDAILMESSLNAAQLQFSQDAKRRQDNNNLGSVLNQLAGNKLGIYQNRYGADVTRENASWLRNSFETGGHNYNLYQNQLSQLDETYKFNINQITTEKSKHEGINSYLNMFAGMFGGGSKGFSTGYNLKTTWNKAAEYKTKLGDND